jgi:hypothetical protein
MGCLMLVSRYTMDELANGLGRASGEPFSDKPATKTPRARGAVTSWVLGRFVPVTSTNHRIFLRGRDAPATEAGMLGLLDELRAR